MAPVLSRSLSTASLASLPSSSSFLLRNSNRNRVLNLTTAFVPQNGLRKRFTSSGLKWKYERRNHQFALWCKAAAVAEKEAADTSSEKFEYQAELWGYYGVGKAALVVIEMVIFGPSLIAYCGVFGGRGIVDVLKILRDLFRTSSFSFLEL